MTASTAVIPKTGDRVRIVGNTGGHGYQIGQVVTLGLHGEAFPGEAVNWEGVEKGSGDVTWFVSADEFEVLGGEAEQLRALLAEAERRGAVKALRRASSDALGRWTMKPYVDEWLRKRADAIENGADY